MPLQRELIPDLEWLAVAAGVDDSWLGPGPRLVNLRPWINRLYANGHRTLVAATYAAAEAACKHWDAWLIASPEIAMQSTLDGRPPPEQLAAVKRWLDAPNAKHKDLVSATVDHTKQLHWFHEEYRDVWFDEAGIWAIEASEYCALTVTGDPYRRESIESFATISIACAVNSFRKSAEHEIRSALAIVVAAIGRQFAELN
jgi:hypothetical protein